MISDQLQPTRDACDDGQHSFVSGHCLNCGALEAPKHPSTQIPKPEPLRFAVAFTPSQSTRWCESPHALARKLAIALQGFVEVFSMGAVPMVTVEFSPAGLTAVRPAMLPESEAAQHLDLGGGAVAPSLPIPTTGGDILMRLVSRGLLPCEHNVTLWQNLDDGRFGAAVETAYRAYQAKAHGETPSGALEALLIKIGRR